MMKLFRDNYLLTTNTKGSIRHIEKVFYELYLKNKEADSFKQLIELFGQQYPLIAYFLFLKNRSMFLPLSPMYMDRVCNIMRINFKTSRQCSWENYSLYIGIMKSFQNLLSKELGHSVTLLDTHSFTWILSNQMFKSGGLSKLPENYELDQKVTEREYNRLCRVGQDVFRRNVEDYWSVCAVTGCSVLLYASHIKPWRVSSDSERLDHFNGLFLSPALDNCFDKGLISFNDLGEIIISSALSELDKAALGIHDSMKLSKVEKEHREYLKYHRQNIFNHFDNFTIKSANGR